MGAYSERTERRGGTVLEGRAGLVVAAVLAVATAVLAGVAWLMLPDQVVVQFGVSGEHYGPKWAVVLIAAALGLGGSGWLAASRAKTGLVLAAVGVGMAVVTLAVNLLLYGA